MNPPEPAPADAALAATSPVGDASETISVAAHDATASTPTTQKAVVLPTTHDAVAPTRVCPPRDTLRLTFKLRLEDAHEVLLDLDDALDFRHGPFKQSVATVGDQVRKVFEAIVAEPLLTTVNQYVRLKLDAGQSPSAVEKPDSPSFPPFSSPNTPKPDGHPFGGADHHRAGASGVSYSTETLPPDSVQPR